MNEEFWHEKWAKNEIGFHEKDGNRLLSEHLHQLALQPGQRILLPLCGKTRDIARLLAQGYQVVGIELSELAIEQLFEELEIKAKIAQAGELSIYSADSIDIFVGNIFSVDENTLGHVDAIYDRAALVALPEVLRMEYVDHLARIAHQAAQLLITFEYDQKAMDGPPFSITQAAIKQYYGDAYQIEHIASEAVSGKLKGLVEASEDVWLLKPR
ncbi:thiopurine S-methyltransferase [Parahaliea sp. F7430]|uniref:Thiopurine S-methyltransferase n=1 Tax=Sediminihaliea albiluteola TaxID=2758564 RepID=A0A7W2YJF5_9GAMM|nr:thiopurine S-methyltransferase [Sediminihaliea albiluteola]MBA6412248.1 thiopurine S-methyltransferase [Sediminihaliea albiluteola]